jgi:hypothetical protein
VRAFLLYRGLLVECVNSRKLPCRLGKFSLYFKHYNKVVDSKKNVEEILEA